MKRIPGMTALALAIGLGLAGCASGGEPAAEAPGSSAVSGEVAAEHNDADVAFAQQMIPHHQQAVEMSDIVLAKDDLDESVRDVAEQIRSAQAPEIDAMNAMLVAWGEEPVDAAGGMDHGGHGGDSGMGMMSEEDLAALEEATGVDASRLYLEGMIEHHRGAVEMAQEQVADGENPEAVSLAQQIIEDQESEIVQMEALLEELEG